VIARRPEYLPWNPMGKGMAQQLLEIGIPIPEALLDTAS
jgi:hypothetical protein